VSDAERGGGGVRKTSIRASERSGTKVIPQMSQKSQKITSDDIMAHSTTKLN